MVFFQIGARYYSSSTGLYPRPLAFLIFINDLDECTNLVAIMKKFAHSTKGGHHELSEGDRDVLQDCINKLLDWADYSLSTTPMTTYSMSQPGMMWIFHQVSSTSVRNLEVHLNLQKICIPPITKIDKSPFTLKNIQTPPPHKNIRILYF